MRKIYFFILLPLFTFYQGQNANAQITINGPTCVVPNTVYSYKISGAWRDSSKLQICIIGGTLAARDTSIEMPNCTPENGAPLAVVNVLWDGSGPGSLSANSDIGIGNLSVSITSPLSAGTINDDNCTQLVSIDSIPDDISCSIDSGGNCSPLYQHQWQQSLDAVSWTDVSLANGDNLSFATKLAQTTYYRRKSTEVASGAIAYSNTAAVFIMPAHQWADSAMSSSDSLTYSLNGKMLRINGNIHQVTLIRLHHLQLLIDSRQFFRKEPFVQDFRC